MVGLPNVPGQAIQDEPITRLNAALVNEAVQDSGREVERFVLQQSSLCQDTLEKFNFVAGKFFRRPRGGDRSEVRAEIEVVAGSPMESMALQPVAERSLARAGGAEQQDRLQDVGRNAVHRRHYAGAPRRRKVKLDDAPGKHGQSGTARRGTENRWRPVLTPRHGLANDSIDSRKSCLSKNHECLADSIQRANAGHEPAAAHFRLCRAFACDVLRARADFRCAIHCHPQRKPQAGRAGLAAHAGAARQERRHALALDRGLLLKAERPGGRDDRPHGLDRTVPTRASSRSRITCCGAPSAEVNDVT